jgi:superfamily II DNA/RNA helicase
MRIQYLLISPTRELCQQSYNVLLKLLNKLPDKERSIQAQRYCYCATGGSELEVDLAKIKEGICVLVGTVGRIR